MDLGTLIGLILAVVCVLVSIVLAAPLSSFIDAPSLIIVLGGSFASTMVNFRLDSVMKTATIVKKTLIYPLPDVTETIQQLVSFANLARREGVLALEEKLEEVTEPFLSQGLRMVVDGSDAASIREVLETEIMVQEDRHKIGKDIMDVLGAAAPAFGMIGTLIGLVAMLQNMSDPSAIGVGMAVALLTTLYGSFFANVFFIPLAGKLERRAKEESSLKTLMVEGIVGISSGEKPRMMEQKLKTFLAPSARETEPAEA